MLRQIIDQPLPLSRRRVTAANLIALTVQRNYMPGAEVVTVVALPRISRGFAEIVVVTRSAIAVILVISGSRTRAVFESPPCRGITLREVFIRSIRISQVAYGEDRAGYFLDQLRGSFCASQIIATGDVARSNENWIARRFGLRFRRSSWPASARWTWCLPPSTEATRSTCRV